MADYQTHQANWQGIPLSVRYCPEPWRSFREVYGYPLAHVTVTASCPLPITGTGFQSLYIAAREIDAEGGPVAFVMAWLDHDAALPEWPS